MPRVIENPHTGERIVIRQSGAETGGELLVFDVFLQQGGHVPARHVHPRQEERFSVIEGQVRFRVGRRNILACQGDTLVVSSGTPHWFGNYGRTVAHLRVEVRPALRMEELFATAVHGSAPGAAWWSRLLNLVLIPLDFQRELAVPIVPQALMTRVLTPLAWLRLRLGATR
jgi:quercetin dioxygenase-like cupin family protein